MAINMNSYQNGTSRTRSTRHSRRHQAPMSEINVTPMVDVMLVLLIIFNLEIYFFNTDSSVSQIPFLDFTNLALISKIFIFIWTIFISIGIWRAAENYKGSIIWIVLTFIIVAYRCYSLRLIFFI